MPIIFHILLNLEWEVNRYVSELAIINLSELNNRYPLSYLLLPIIKMIFLWTTHCINKE